MEGHLSSSMDELSILENGNTNARMVRRRQNHSDTTVYKSKNLQAERRRRQKLSERLLVLRSLVPLITNMNKAMIVEDAITYIKKLQNDVRVLSDELLEMEASSEEWINPMKNEVDSTEEMKKWGIKTDVEVNNIGGNKILIKVVVEKRKGNFTKLMEGMSGFGFEFTDISVTTSKGAILISACVEGNCDEKLEVHQTKDLLQQIMREI